MTSVQKLEQLERALRSSSGKQQTLSDLGHLKSDLGLAALGLEDQLRAYALHVDPDTQVLNATLPDLRGKFIDGDSRFPVPGTPFKILALLAESLRIYARDVDFSATPNGLDRTLQTMTASMKCFVRAEKERAGQSAQQQAWLLAHLGGARTMGFWLKQALGKDVGGDVFGSTSPDALFVQAIGDFDAALALRSEYPWCKRFKAFLLTIRGAASDFPEAQTLLEQAREEGALADSSFEASLAILLFNAAVSATLNVNRVSQASINREAAKASLERASSAVRIDPENFRGAFYGAASMTLLAEGTSEESQIYKRNACGAIQSARIRAVNAISQAATTLVSLSALESHSGCSSEDRSSFHRYLAMAKETPADLETRVVFDRAIRQILKLDRIDPEIRRELEDFIQTSRPTTLAI